jgi:CDP-diacylglycerol--serine O-phosphatidyltransferase
MRQLVKQIPNIITSLNLLSGTLAIFFAIDGHLTWAGIFICLAALFDFLDGLAARILNAGSETGKHLDSLADLVSFGLAPASILFTLLEFSLFEKNMPVYEISANTWQWLVMLSTLLMPLSGAIRLARFNAFQADEIFFRGLPIPSNGLFWAAMGMMPAKPELHELFRFIYDSNSLFIMGLFTSGLMLITMPMFSLKFKSTAIKENWYRYLFLIIAIILLLFLNIYGLVLAILLYILLNIVFYLAGLRY